MTRDWDPPLQAVLSGQIRAHDEMCQRGPVARSVRAVYPPGGFSRLPLPVRRGVPAD
jgi:hypothetical protein